MNLAAFSMVSPIIAGAVVDDPFNLASTQAQK